MQRRWLSAMTSSANSSRSEGGSGLRGALTQRRHRLRAAARAAMARRDRDDQISGVPVGRLPGIVSRDRYGAGAAWHDPEREIAARDGETLDAAVRTEDSWTLSTSQQVAARCPVTGR